MAAKANDEAVKLDWVCVCTAQPASCNFRPVESIEQAGHSPASFMKCALKSNLVGIEGNASFEEARLPEIGEAGSLSIGPCD